MVITLKASCRNYYTDTYQYSSALADNIHNSFWGTHFLNIGNPYHPSLPQRLSLNVFPDLYCRSSHRNIRFHKFDHEKSISNILPSNVTESTCTEPGDPKDYVGALWVGCKIVNWLSKKWFTIDYGIEII